MFQASLRNPSSDIAVTESLTGDSLVITDCSNYDSSSETEHDRTTFDAFRQVKIDLPSRAVVTMNNLLSGSLSASLPSSGDDDIAYSPGSTLKSGVYIVSLLTVPSHQGTGDYQADEDCVCVVSGSSVSFYMCIQDTASAAIAVTDDEYWELIDEADVPSKYTASETLAVMFSAVDCGCESIEEAVCYLLKHHCDEDVMNSPRVKKAAMMQMALDAIRIFSEAGEWQKVRDAFNLKNKICCC